MLLNAPRPCWRSNHRGYVQVNRNANGLAEQGRHSFRQPRCIPRGKIDKHAASLRRVPSRAEHWLRWLAVNEKKPSLPPGLKRTSGISRLGPQGDAGVLHLDILAPFSHDWHCIGMTNGTTPRSRRRHARIGSMPFAMRLSAVVSSPMWRRMAALPRRIACSTLAILSWQDKGAFGFGRR